jgi:hypothetical protein
LTVAKEVGMGNPAEKTTDHPATSTIPRMGSTLSRAYRKNL